ncbi:MAG: hemerythrin family protein [Gammaproteobacteria bacterium]|nr:hemerythrin family protein [Gammaproteobacteria bacterium]
MISWNETTILNVAEMDSQHQRLFTLVTNLHQAMASSQGANNVSRALEELVAFTQLHFATEEALMTRYAYPEYETHKQEHEHLLQDVGQLLQRFRDGDVLIPFAIELDLEAWALRHIESRDKQLALFLNSKGVF